MKMYNQYAYNLAVFNPNRITEEYRLSLQISNLTFKIEANTLQYNYQARLLNAGKIHPDKFSEFSSRVACLGMEIQKDKSRLVELGKAMAALSHHIDPKNYRPKF